MGYTTSFGGQIDIEPPLNDQEYSFLIQFAATRHDEDGVPGIWCQWIPNEDGTALEWDGNEKFYNSAEWMAHLIETYLRPGATAAAFVGSTAYAGFTFDHSCNGEIYAQGEEEDDMWALFVRDNEVRTADAVVTYPNPFGDG